MSVGKKKFGAFGGVFTPSLLTILGVIMYLRLGWVVGHAGLWGALIIVLIAHIISITTGLSISSIATDKKVGAGGVYYVLSRSLGLPIGGAIGLTLFIGTALSIALYIVGFSESFNDLIGIESTLNNIRLTGSVALLILTIIAFISTSLAIKAQYFILAAIFISLGAIIFGVPVPADAIPVNTAPTPSLPMATIFAIFFPAVTGFTAGIAMSGDLKDPKKAIPLGTISAIGVGFIVYVGLVIFLYFKVDAELLKTDYRILERISIFAPAVVAGIWGATLSSALGGILGGPRILQAMSLDKITPMIFGKEQGKSKEPRIALIAAIILAELGILIGDLDIVARVVSMFYLAAYGFINISFFLESWASADFRPSFKVNKWFGFVGFLATFGVMFQLDMLAMFMALIVIGGIYLWLTRREIALGTGDIWRSVWSTGVKEGLKRLESKDDHKRNWKPNILLFSGNSDARPHLIEFSQALAGRSGLVTNFDLIENKGMDILFTKHKQSVKDELLHKYGIFGRQIEVKNIYKGIETIASTFGFSGVDPNTVLMGWARNTKDPIWFAQMTQSLIDLDYNVLYMDYDVKRGFGNRQQIDLWWRGISNNAELMLQIAKFISFNADWRNAVIRILLVNDFNVDRRIIENRITKLLEEFRLTAQIKIIDNHLEQKPFYDILKSHSLRSDLVLIGIPFIVEGSESAFVTTTNELTEVIGTTLMVKASSTFDETRLGLKQMTESNIDLYSNEKEIQLLELSDQNILDQELQNLDLKLSKIANDFGENYLRLINQHYQAFLEKQIAALFAVEADFRKDLININSPEFSIKSIEISSNFREDDLSLLKEILAQGIEQYLNDRKNIFASIIKSIDLPSSSDSAQSNKKLQVRRILNNYEAAGFNISYSKTLKEFGIISSNIVIRCKEAIKEILENISNQSDPSEKVPSINEKMAELREFSNILVSHTLLDIRNGDRKILNASIKGIINDHIKLPHRSNFITGKDKNWTRKLEFIEDYASFWYRNQQLFHFRFETGIELKRTNLILKSGSVYLIDNIKNKTENSLLSEIKSLKIALKELQNNTDTKNDVAHHYDLNIGHYPLFDYVPSFRNFRKKIGKATDQLPTEIEMMDAGSELNMSNIQGKNVNTVSFSVDKIADYLIETSFISKIQNNLDQHTKEVNGHIGELINLSGMINYRIRKMMQKGKIAELEKFTEKYTRKLNILEESIRVSSNSFEADTKEVLNATTSLLQVQHIIEQAETLKQYVRKKEIRKGIKGHLRNYRSEANRQIQKLFDLISDNKEKIRSLEYDRQKDMLKNPGDLLREFIFSVSAENHSKFPIPFYYKQLFSGKHLQSGKTLTNRAGEIEKIISTIRHIENGVNGAILITGPSISGKSFLTEHVIQHYLSGNSFYITPNPGGSNEAKDLNQAFSRVTGIISGTDDILQKSEAGSVFVFNDLESWWLNRYNGDSAINEIVELVKRHGNRHFFIFNCNIHTFKRIEKSSHISDIIATTVLLKPLSKAEIKKEILRRHKIGGISLYYKGDLIDAQREDRHISSLFKRIHATSGGNIGFAYQIWLSAINTNSEGKYTLKLPEKIEFPDIKSSDWVNLLLQLLLHKSIGRDRFRFLYKSMGEHWIERMERELNTSLILSKPGIVEYELKKIIRIYLEEYLSEKQIL